MPERAVKLLFFVAASPCRHWAICAPAAGHSHGCHLSGTLSGIEPQSPGPVTGFVVHYTTNNLIGSNFVQHRVKRRYCKIGLPQLLQLPSTGVGFCIGQ
jgi:hypothetical protein